MNNLYVLKRNPYPPFYGTIELGLKYNCDNEWLPNTSPLYHSTSPPLHRSADNQQHVPIPRTKLIVAEKGLCTFFWGGILIDVDRRVGQQVSSAAKWPPMRKNISNTRMGLESNRINADWFGLNGNEWMENGKYSEISELSASSACMYNESVFLFYWSLYVVSYEINLFNNFIELFSSSPITFFYLRKK